MALKPTPQASQQVGHIRIGHGTVDFAGRNVGFLTGGVAIAQKLDVVKIPNVDGLYMNARNDLMGKSYTIKMVLYETTLDNVKLAFASDAVIELSADGNSRTLKIDAKNYLPSGVLKVLTDGPTVNEVAKDWTVTFYKVQLIESSEVKFGQDEHTKIGLTFETIYDKDHPDHILEIKETISA
jgi:hypothetical protein